MITFYLVSKSISDVILWHMRLRHISLSNMKNISSFHHFSVSKFLDPCDVCFKARQSKLPFQCSTISITSMFELIHIDTWWPYKLPTHERYKYFLSIADDYSKTTWTYLLKTKSNGFYMLQSFLAMVHTQFNAWVKTIRSYNALELGTSSFTSDFLFAQGILHQTTCVNTP